MPVSYTHLDVYKRQLLVGAQAAGVVVTVVVVVVAVTLGAEQVTASP